MLRKYFYTIAGLLMVDCHAAYQKPQWFHDVSPISLAHQHLLEGKTAQSFSAMITAWQQATNAQQQRNITALLRLAIDDNDGRNLYPIPLPAWLSSLTLTRETTQTPNEINYQLSVAGHSLEPLTQLSLTAWPKKAILSGQFQPAESHFNLQVTRLSPPILSGLYQLALTTQSGKKWRCWVLFTQQHTQNISWKNDLTWYLTPEIEKRFQQTSGTLPELSLQIYQQQAANKRQLVWAQNKASYKPNYFPRVKLPPSTYWYSAALIEYRWQGAILFKDVQRISKIYTPSDL